MMRKMIMNCLLILCVIFGSCKTADAGLGWSGFTLGDLIRIEFMDMKVDLVMKSCSFVSKKKCNERLDQFADNNLMQHDGMLINAMKHVAGKVFLDVNNYRAGKYFEIIFDYADYKYGPDSYQLIKLLIDSSFYFENRAKQVEFLLRAENIAKSKKDYDELIKIYEILHKIYYDHGNHSDAETVMLKLLAATENLYGSTHQEVGYYLGYMSNYYLNTKQYEKYESVLERRLNIFLDSVPSLVTETADELAEYYESSDQYAKAQQILERALDNGVKNKFNLNRIRERLARIYRNLHNLDKAISVAKDNYEDAVAPSSVFHSIDKLRDLAATYAAAGKFDESINAYSLAVDRSLHLDGSFKPDIYRDYRTIGLLYHEKKDTEKELIYYKLSVVSG